LQDLTTYITEIKDFIAKFVGQGYFKKCWRSNSDAELFIDYNEGFAQRAQNLQFDVQVKSEIAREEDAKDAEQVQEMC
jgi:hypothetical protein